jgi:Leucine-rich repeat (LRR) protein
MRHFHAPNARLESIPSLSHLPLVDVDVQGNRLWSLEGLPLTLETLSAEDNKLEQEGLFLPFPFLKKLFVSRNNLVVFDEGDFVLCFPSLEELDMSHNKLRHTGFLRHSILQYLNVSHNRLHLLSGLPPTLRTVVADSNEITMVQSKLPPHLESMDLSYNYLHFAGLPLNWPSSLRELHLNCNQIERLPRNLPEGLELLTLNNNKLQGLPYELPSSLRMLAVSSNRIQSLPQWKSNRFVVLLIDNNCLTEPVSSSLASVVSADSNWNEPIHAQSQRILRRCWKRYVLTLRLRQYKRMQQVKEELFMVSMQPARWMQVDVLDPVWFRKQTHHIRTGHHWD